MVSDYDYPIGWVEQYIYDTKHILETHWHQVYIIGLSAYGLVRHHFFRLLCMPITWFNIIITIRLLYHIIVHRPALIYRHNIHRFCGWLPLYVAHICKINSCMMYHDLGYFSLYPSRVTKESDIDLTFSKQHFLSGCHGLHRFFAYIKYRHLKLLHIALRKYVHIHFVPSEYMQRYVQDIIQVPSDRISTLAHCLIS